MNLRHQTLQIIEKHLNKLIQTPSFQTLPEKLQEVLENDAEKNILVALRILNQSLSSAQGGYLNSILDRLKSFCIKRIQQTKQFIQDFTIPSNDIVIENKMEATLNFFKLIPQIVDLIILISKENDREAQNLQAMAKEAWYIIENHFLRLNSQPFPPNILKNVQNGRLYHHYLTLVIDKLLTLVEAARSKEEGQQFEFPQMLKVYLALLNNLPPETEAIRNRILTIIQKAILSGKGDKSKEQQQTQVNKQIPDPIPQGSRLIDVIASHFLDHIIDFGLMQGKDRPSSIVQVTHVGILYELCKQKDYFDNQQIQRVYKIVCRSLRDDSLSLSEKSTLTFYLHDINGRYGEIGSNQNQMEFMICLIDLCQILQRSIDISISQQAAEQKNPEHSEAEIEFELGEKDLLEPAKPYHASEQASSLQDRNGRPVVDNSKTGYKDLLSRLMWNIVASAGKVFDNAIKQRKQQEGGGTGTFIGPEELKTVKRFFLEGSNAIQRMNELGPLQQKSEQVINQSVRHFVELFWRVRPLQLRDILNDIGPQFFTRYVVAKTNQSIKKQQKGANYEQQNTISDQLLYSCVGVSTSRGDQPRSGDDEYSNSFVEALYDYVSSRLQRFNASNSIVPGLGADDELDPELQCLPKVELQEVLIDLALIVGERALARPNDIRMKHIFFSVFVFCVKQAKEGELVVDHYYVVIIRLFRSLCSPEHEGLVKEFLPMIQGLLETFLQSRDSEPFIDVTNHIFECIPAKLKSLLDYLPVISKPVVESMRTVAHADLERPLNTLQLWVSGLGQFPEILDPSISHVLPELNSMLYKILYQRPDFPFKLLGKLGAKSRNYWQDQDVSSRRYPEGGLKISLKDKYSGREIVFSIDAAIEVVLVKIFENPNAYTLSKLLDAFKLVQTALLCYIDANVDLDYVIARICGVKDMQKVDAKIFEAASTFNSNRRQNNGCFLARGSEAHAFEKILRSLLFACSLPEDNPDTLKVRQKAMEFMKWVTQYFTLLYVCKNGRNTVSKDDEVNPLKFLETISAFLLYNLRQGVGKPKSISCFEGANVCLETCAQLLNQLFGDRPEVFSELEIVEILIKKVCHLAYEQDLRKKLAVTFALPTVLQELPRIAVRKYSQHIFDALCQILNTTSELSVPSAKEAYNKALDMLLEKIGLFNPLFVKSSVSDDITLFNGLAHKIFLNLYNLQPAARSIAASVIEKIAIEADITVNDLALRVPFVNAVSQAVHPGQAQNWKRHIINEIEQLGHNILPWYKGGVTKVYTLISNIDVLRFAMKHRILERDSLSVLLGVSELLLVILESEASQYDSRADPEQSDKRNLGVENPSSCAQKYMKLERFYILQNQDYDPFSHTLHPHELLTSQHFEVTYLAKRDKEKRQDERIPTLSCFKMNIFNFEQFNNEHKFCNPDEQGTRALTEQQLEEMKAKLTSNCQAFTQKLFPNNTSKSKFSDISYEYVNHLYVLFPNVRIRTELICKCLEALCDFVTREDFAEFLRERQLAHYGVHSQQDGVSQGPDLSQARSSNVLKCKLDFYAVEIKAKTIAIYFKYLQREEHNILGTARACLERLLSESPNQQEALPNQILKECVRPALNVLSSRIHSPPAFKHLAMLIEVLYSCFNDQLAQHLMGACVWRQSAVLQPFQQNRDQNSNADPNNPHSADTAANKSLIEQYNLFKIGSLETTVHIVQVLHLLPNSRMLILNWVADVPEFELKASRGLEPGHVPITQDHATLLANGLEFRPIRVRFGVLQSDFRDGLAKFFNKNPVDVIHNLDKSKIVQNLLLTLMKSPDSYAIRERIARDIDQTIRSKFNKIKNFSSDNELQQQLLVVRLVWILTKFNPSFLCQHQHSDILQNLRAKWVKLSEISIDGTQNQENQLEQKQLYRKLLKCLLTYCRNEKSDKQVLFDLIKGFSYQPLIDLSPLLKFTTEEVPNKFSHNKQIGIMEATLIKLEKSRGSHEQRYAMFEFAFMPLALASMKSKQMFETLFSDRMVVNFLNTFFQSSDGKPKWLQHQRQLEHSSQVWFEDFLTEITKALCIMLLKIEDINRFRPFIVDFQPEICFFLNNLAYRSVNISASLWACFAFSVLALKAQEAAQGKLLGQQRPLMEQISIKCIEGYFIQFHEKLLSNCSMENADKGLAVKTMGNLIMFASNSENSEIINGQVIEMFERLDFETNRLQVELATQVIETLTTNRRPRDFDMSRSQGARGADSNRYYILLRDKLYKLIQTSDRPQSPNSIQRIIKAAKTVIYWQENSISDGQSSKEDPASFCKVVFGHLMDLVHLSMINHVKTIKQSEVENMLTQILEVMKRILEIYKNKNGAMDPPDTMVESEDAPQSMPLRMFEINAAYLMVEYGNFAQDQRMFTNILTTFQQVRSKEPKCVVFTLALFEKVVLKLLGTKDCERKFDQIYYKLKELVENEIQGCLRVLEDENALDKLDPHRQEKLPDSRRKWSEPALHQAMILSKIIPHFSTRLTTCLDKLALENPNEPCLLKLREQIVDFPFCKELVKVLFRVIGKFRRQVAEEEPTYTKISEVSDPNQPLEFDDKLVLEGGILNWQEFEPELDRFNKESVMDGLKVLARKTHSFPNKQATNIFESLQWLPVALLQFKSCDYITEAVNDLIGILIHYEPGQERFLQAEKQYALVFRLVERLNESFKMGRKKPNPYKIYLIDKLFKTCTTFLERQNSLMTENSNKLMDLLLITSQGRSVELKHKLFTIFEKCYGQNLYQKLKFFFSAHQLENSSRPNGPGPFVISQLLDFTLMNFRTASILEKLPHSAQLLPINEPRILIEHLSLEETQLTERHQKIRQVLGNFIHTKDQFRQLRLSDLLNPLSEVISINPSYHDDKPLADILFTEILSQLWSILSRQEQQFLAECINNMFLNAIKNSNSLQQLMKPPTTFARTILESVASLQPQIRLAPELLQYMAKELNLWHAAIPILENHIILHPKNERYVMALSEVYSQLHEEDYLAGLRRSFTESEETRTIVTFGQHGKWEEIHSLFSHYILYYAEQEGLYAHLDLHQAYPGKYSRQYPRASLQELLRLELVKKNPHITPNEVEAQFKHRFEETVKSQLDNKLFPKPGPNSKVDELDLRVWENLFVESLHVLNKWDQYRDIAHLHGDHDNKSDTEIGTKEMWIEFYWQKREWKSLSKFKSILQNSNSVKYRLYYTFLVIAESEQQKDGQQTNEFDKALKKVIELADRVWRYQLPNYVDRAQCESLIFFQQALESNEGGRSMIREAKNLSGDEHLKELKAAMKIWRERIPHQCESIKTWKEILENRNFIYEFLCKLIQNNQQNIQGQPQPTRKNEQLDINWNQLKLASVSRKQGLPSLALYYQDAAKLKLQKTTNSEYKPENPGDQLEDIFKLEYEALKLEIMCNTENPEALDKKVRDTMNLFERTPKYELWQRASISRVVSNYYISQGRLSEAREKLKDACQNLNKRDPKLWLSWAKLHETYLENPNFKDEYALVDALKGLLYATTLSLHKSRLIIPRILKLLRTNCRLYKQSQNIANFLQLNIDQMPVWIWIFWIPQLFNLILSDKGTVEQHIGKTIFIKLLRTYPQSLYYPLRAKFSYQRKEHPHFVQTIKELISQLKHRNTSILNDLETIGREIYERIKPQNEESLCNWLQTLEFGKLILQRDVEQCFKTFLDRLFLNYFQVIPRQNMSPLLKELAPVFKKDFIDEETKEKNIPKAMLKLRNLRDYLLQVINSRDATMHLEDLSPFLARFTRGSIEIPGQYLVNDEEPLPQRTVYLDRFDSLVHRCLGSRKLVFKGSNSKQYPFQTAPIQDYLKFCSEERVTQMKVLMNMVFKRHKETLRRGAKFYVPSKIVIFLSKLSQDDLTFQDFQETHDFLLQEKGVDPDIAYLLQIRQVRKLLEEGGQAGRDLQSIKKEEIKNLTQSCYEQMVGKGQSLELYEEAGFVPSSLMTSYFHRIFYNVDDLFLFKKRFTTYHAVNSFFSYAFNQTEHHTLVQMSFCKQTGRLSFNDPRLRSSQKLGMTQKSKFDEIEAKEFDSEKKILPFRLTPNFVDFIGHIGLNGLFAGVMTSCSMAISKHSEKINCFVSLALRDDFFHAPNEENASFEFQASKNSEYIMFKIKSLSNHRRVLDLNLKNEAQRDDSEMKPQDKSSWTKIGDSEIPPYMLDLSIQKPDMPEEFNKKVFRLMDMAMDDKRKAQAQIIWCPWF